MSKPQYETYGQPQYAPHGPSGSYDAYDAYDPYGSAYGYGGAGAVGGGGAAEGPATQVFTAAEFSAADGFDRAAGFAGNGVPTQVFGAGGAVVDELPTRAFTPDAFAGGGFAVDPPLGPDGGPELGSDAGSGGGAYGYPHPGAQGYAEVADGRERRGAGGGVAGDMGFDDEALADGEAVGEGRAEGRREARRRRTAERPDGLRRLVPQALVVAFLAGGTSAFVANDKAVQLTVDGKARTLHTFADDVGELLADEGVDVGAHDIVAPPTTTALASGDEIAVRYGRPVQLTLDGHRREVWTTARTVDGALQQLGVRAEGAYLSASRSKRIAREGLDLDVRTERTVTIMADGRSRTIRTNAATVGEAVEESGVTLRGSDTTSVPPGSFPRDGQTVTVMRISGRKEVREEPIPYDVRKTEDPSLPRGTEVVAQAGREGARRITYSVRTVNGVRQKPKRLRSEVVREPQTRIVKVGTKVVPTAVAGAEGLNWGALAACESGGRPSAVDPSGTYGGLYQFDTQTWQSLGGSGRPQDAPAAEQTHRAKKLYVQRGASPWPHCGRRL
ncbi:resuscitation-promoting factor [Streptomyces flavofungini]|uniref:resuscitation-promoting factor n=1 Tax=Streptomyces flavofungini TaxID=68200 RepID=UPI0025AF3B01|nr:resuscitation-promoting factor [Streptomyces flavofungini]WJV48197.1 ubiquitin-like domain-containing protein [Streptomyces flavofungini]